MKARAAALASMLALPPGLLQAQWGGYASLGARYGTTLVSDVVVRPIDVRQAVAPVLAAGLVTSPGQAWSAEAALDATLTGLRREEAGESVDLGGVTTLSFTVALRRRLVPDLTARAGAGALFYVPEQESGIFARGSPGATPVGLVGLTWAPAVGRRYRLALDLRYDVHRFNTPALRAVGFDEGRAVHRVALAVRTAIGGIP